MTLHIYQGNSANQSYIYILIKQLNCYYLKILFNTYRIYPLESSVRVCTNFTPRIITKNNFTIIALDVFCPQ